VLFDALMAGGRGFAGSILRSAGHGGPYPKASGTLLDQATTGLATAVRSDWQVSTYPYVYTLSATVPKASGLAPAEQALFRALETATAKAWTEADIRRALHQVRTGVALDLDDQRGRVHQLALFEVAGGYAHLATLPERVAQVSLDDVRRFARTRLSPDRATVGWFEPREAAGEPVRAPEAAAKPGAKVPAPPPSATRTASVRTTFLSSGSTVTVEEQRGATLASLRGRIEVGSAHDGAAPGLAALAAALLAEPQADEGASTPSVAWAQRHEPTAAVNLHAIEVTARVLPEDLGEALGVLARRMSQPPPDGRAFEELREKAVRHAEEQNASADGLLLARTLAELFPSGSPTARPPWADGPSLSRITPETFASFWRQEVTPGNLRLAVAGNVTTSAVGAALEASFREVPRGASRARREPPTPRGPEAWKEIRISVPDLLQDEVLVVWPGDRSRPADVAATEALLYLLGETGYAGRLADALVDPGLVYSVETSLEGEGRSSWFAVRTACDTKDTAEVLGRIRKTLEEAARGRFTEAEAQEALAYLRGKAARQREGSANVAAALLREKASGTGEVTLDALNDAARRLFARGFPIALVAGPKSDGE
jgi:zinc protease